jgi:hypothetical protein
LENAKKSVDSIYINKNKNKVFSTKELYSLSEIQITKEHFYWRDSIAKSILNKMQFPNKYLIKNDRTPNLSAEFIIRKNNTVDEIKIHTSNIKKRYIRDISNQLKKEIHAINWEAVDLYGLKLNTEESLNLILLLD